MILKMKNEEKKIIGNRIKEVRNENDLSVREFGKILKCSGPNICRYEQGEVENIPIARIRLIAEKFNVSPLWLMGMSDVKKKI